MASYVLTFTDYTPSPREDGVAWTQAQIFEAASKDGPFDTPIETINLSPLDTDPTEPQPRTFTTHNATMQDGWYQVVFLDDFGNQSPAEPVQNVTERTGYMPGVGDVGALLTARTRDGNGNEAGTFTASTRPTRDQVERLIDKAAQRTLAKLPTTSVPEPLWGALSSVIALSAAMRVELSFFPDQIQAGRSPYTELKALRDEELADVLVDLEAHAAADGDDDPYAASGLPAWSGPPEACRAPGAEIPFPLRFPYWPFNGAYGERDW